MKEKILIGLLVLFLVLIFLIIRFFKKNFFNKPIAENLIDGSNFYIEDDGKYALWGKSRKRRINNLTFESPVIYNWRNEPLEFSKTLMNMHVSSENYSSIKLGTFEARSGSYKLGTIYEPFSPIDILPYSDVNEVEPVEYIVNKDYPILFFSLAV